MEMNKLLENKKGGARAGAGRKKADYSTQTVSFRVRVEIAEDIKLLVKDYIASRGMGLG
jgi:hypothetical protein